MKPRIAFFNPWVFGKILAVAPIRGAVTPIPSEESVLTIPEKAPKWKLTFSRFSQSVPGKKPSNIIFLDIHYMKGGLNPEVIKTIEPKGATRPIDLFTGFGTNNAKKQQDLHALRLVLGMADRTAAAKDFSEKIAEIPTQKTAGTWSGVYFVCRNSKLYGVIKQGLFPIEDIKEIAEILEKWAEYEGFARLQGYRPK